MFCGTDMLSFRQQVSRFHQLVSGLCVGRSLKLKVKRSGVVEIKAIGGKINGTREMLPMRLPVAESGKNILFVHHT